ncbi:hypothetical protein [Saccharopolyspora spinosa]|uniref:hypothetical protein n=1 Tax=Saccharopolyspora spinosa TaxID=60894 RepID=UPI000319D890
MSSGAQPLHPARAQFAMSSTGGRIATCPLIAEPPPTPPLATPQEHGQGRLDTAGA